jgi:SNF2 family DNA or RNA helicase
VKDVPSAKVDVLAQVCTELFAEEKRVVVTSSFTSMLKLLEGLLEKAGLSSVRITGDMSGPARKRASTQFRDGTTSILLIQLSLAEGIELPEGDAVILFEPWWNAKKEEQAVARLRRDERDKHVRLLRFVVTNSVEEGVLRLAGRKLADIEAVHAGHASASSGLTLNDIEDFFKPMPAVPDVD